MWVLPLGRGGDAWWIPVFPLCLSIVGCGIIIIYFSGVAGGEHRDAAGFDTGAETEKYEARCVGQEPRLLLLCPFFSDQSAYRSVS